MKSPNRFKIKTMKSEYYVMTNYFGIAICRFLVDLTVWRDVNDDDVSKISYGDIIGDYGIRRILISSPTMSRNFRR